MTTLKKRLLVQSVRFPIESYVTKQQTKQSHKVVAVKQLEKTYFKTFPGKPLEKPEQFYTISFLSMYPDLKTSIINQSAVSSSKEKFFKVLIIPANFF